MAQKTVVLLEDDLDGGPADQTVRFTLDGVHYEIDLSATNASKLRDVFHPHAIAGRRVRVAGPRPSIIPDRRATNGSARTDREQLAAIRAWARGRGLPVKDRGRIPRDIVDRYNAGR